VSETAVLTVHVQEKTESVGQERTQMRLRNGAKETKNDLIRNRNEVVGHLTELFRQINHKMLYN